MEWEDKNQRRPSKGRVIKYLLIRNMLSCAERPRHLAPLPRLVIYECRRSPSLAGGVALFVEAKHAL